MQRRASLNKDIKIIFYSIENSVGITIQSGRRLNILALKVSVFSHSGLSLQETEMLLKIISPIGEMNLVF